MKSVALIILFTTTILNAQSPTQELVTAIDKSDYNMFSEALARGADANQYFTNGDTLLLLLFTNFVNLRAQELRYSTTNYNILDLAVIGAILQYTAPANSHFSQAAVALTFGVMWANIFNAVCDHCKSYKLQKNANAQKAMFLELLKTSGIDALAENPFLGTSISTIYEEIVNPVPITVTEGIMNKSYAKCQFTCNKKTYVLDPNSYEYLRRETIELFEAWLRVALKQKQKADSREAAPQN